MAICNYRNGWPGSIDTSPTRSSGCGPAGPHRSAFSSTSGRRSGKDYRTPLTVFNAEVDGKPGVAILLTYGPDRDCLKNLNAAGRAQMRRHGKTFSVTNPQTVTKAEAASTSAAQPGGCSPGCLSSRRFC